MNVSKMEDIKMSKKPVKIVTIGGGSSYTPELMEGFIKRYEELPIKEIWLVDIEDGKEKVEIVGALAQRMWDASPYDVKVYTTLDRREALKDADFVTTQFRVGLLDARIKDERIPSLYGMLGQETNGAGGMFKAFRTIPVIGQIIEDMRELCPDAWLINFTNPSGMVTEAVIKHFGWKKCIGLCNVPTIAMMAEPKLLGKDISQLNYRYAGINHFHWHKVFDENGNDIHLKKDDTLDEESYKIDIAENIVISAADDLGFVYALLKISEKYLDIKPFWFWLDQKIEKKDSVRIEKCKINSPKPKVKYRGWFFNDEVLMMKWKINGDKKEPWRMAFETLLRCGGNMTIPGTDKNSRLNRQMAADMGLWITHHHAEPLGAEIFARAYPGVEANFMEKSELFYKLWEDAVIEQKDCNVIWNLCYYWCGFNGQRWSFTGNKEPCKSYRRCRLGRRLHSIFRA